MPKTTVQVYECECVKCGKSWVTRKHETPERCPYCSARTWEGIESLDLTPGKPAAPQARVSVPESPTASPEAIVRKRCPRHRDIEWAACRAPACKMDYADYLARLAAG